MERRNFLKGIFGAAAIAAMPNIVLSQIENAPPQFPPDRIEGKKVIKDGEDILYLYDDNKLVGQSNDFFLNVNRELIDVTTISNRRREWTGTYKKNGKKKYKWVIEPNMYPEYKQGRLRWNITSERIQWFVEPKTLFTDCTMLKCICKYKDIKMQGEVMIESMNLNSCIYGVTEHSATFTGNGTLIMILQKG
jgi:hypothetical protein